MPIKNNLNQQSAEKSPKKETTATSSRKRDRKAPGTRMGTLADWREGSASGAKPSSSHGRAIRDGR
jgi:hypothetical protein